MLLGRPQPLARRQRVNTVRCLASQPSQAVVLLSRTSLRLDDNPALLAATSSGAAVTLAVCAEELPASAALSLAALQASVPGLRVLRGEPAPAVAALAAELRAATVYACAEPESLAAEELADVAAALSGASVQVCRLQHWAAEPASDNWREHLRLRGPPLPPQPAPSWVAAPPPPEPAAEVLLTEAGAAVALQAYLSEVPSPLLDAAAAADAVRAGTSFQVLFGGAIAHGLLSPRRIAACATEALDAHLLESPRAPAWRIAAGSALARRARQAVEAAERSSFHTTLALAPPTSSQVALPPGAMRRWWRWRGALLPYVHLPGPVGAPALMLVHGFGAYGEHWRRNLALADSADVFAPTMPGFGRSEKAALPYSQALWTDCLADFITEVIQGPTAVAGNSIGGFMSAELAGRHPELVTALVLVNSAGPLRGLGEPEAPPAPRTPPPALVINALTTGLLFFLERTVASTLRRCYPVRPDNSDGLEPEIFRAACDSGASAVFASAFYLPPPTALDALVRRFRGPTLVLQGARDPLNDAPSRAERLGAFCSNAEVVLLEGGHCACLQPCVSKALTRAPRPARRGA